MDVSGSEARDISCWHIEISEASLLSICQKEGRPKERLQHPESWCPFKSPLGEEKDEVLWFSQRLVCSDRVLSPLGYILLIF